MKNHQPRVEHRVLRQVMKLVGCPPQEARDEFVRIFSGPLIGGGEGVASVDYDPVTRTAVFRALGVEVEVVT